MAIILGFDVGGEGRVKEIGGPFVAIVANDEPACVVIWVEMRLGGGELIGCELLVLVCPVCATNLYRHARHQHDHDEDDPKGCNS